MAKLNTYFIKYTALIIYLGLAIGLEAIYRPPLFQYSLTWIKEWQNSTSELTHRFFMITSEFGSEIVFAPLFIIAYFCFTLQKAFVFLNVICYAVYTQGVLKMLYRSFRPFMVDPEIFMACQGGYGNPSGHTITSVATYLAFWNLVTDYQFMRKHIYLRIIALILFILLIFSILAGVFYTGTHSLNQILYAVSLGVAIYVNFFHIAQYNKLSEENFFSLFTNKYSIILHCINYAALVIIGALLYSFLPFNNEPYETNFKTLCPGSNPLRSFQKEALVAVLILNGAMGSYFGILFVSFMVNPSGTKEVSYAINHWLKGRFLNRFFILLLFVAFLIPWGLIGGLIPSDAVDPIVFPLKVWLPLVMASFSVFGPVVYTAIKLKLTPDINYANVKKDTNIPAGL
jgi:hypothetical protein